MQDNVPRDGPAAAALRALPGGAPYLNSTRPFAVTAHDAQPAAQDVLRRQTAALVDPYAVPVRSALAELDAKMCNMAAMGLERVGPAGPDVGMTKPTAGARAVRKVSPGPSWPG